MVNDLDESVNMLYFLICIVPGLATLFVQTEVTWCLWAARTSLLFSCLLLWSTFFDKRLMEGRLVCFQWRLLAWKSSLETWNKIITQKSDRFINKCSLPLLNCLLIWPNQASFMQRRGKLRANGFWHIRWFGQMDLADWCPQRMTLLLLLIWGPCDFQRRYNLRF